VIKKELFNVKFFFDDVTNPTIQKISHAHYRIIDDFGEIKMGFEKFTIKTMDIYARSLHRIANESLPMEIIISAVKTEFKNATKGAQLKKGRVLKTDTKASSSNPLDAIKTEAEKPTPKLLKFSLLFEQAHVPYVELFTLGIGRGMIRKLPTKRADPLNSSLVLHTTFNLNNLVDNYKKVIWYEALSIMDDCKPATFVILFEKLWVGPIQMSEFRETTLKRLEFTRKLQNTTLWSNFVARA